MTPLLDPREPTPAEMEACAAAWGMVTSRSEASLMWVETAEGYDAVADTERMYPLPEDVVVENGEVAVLTASHAAGDPLRVATGGGGRTLAPAALRDLHRLSWPFAGGGHTRHIWRRCLHADDRERYLVATVVGGVGDGFSWLSRWDLCEWLTMARWRIIQGAGAEVQPLILRDGYCAWPKLAPITHARRNAAAARGCPMNILPAGRVPR